VPARVRALLDEGISAGVVQVQAPAGCGKTGSVLQYLFDRQIDAWWHACKPEDANPATFLAGLVQTLGGASSSGGQTTLAAIASRDITTSYGAALKPFLEDMATANPSGQVLVLDDVDALTTSPEALVVLDYAVAALAQHVPVIVISRTDVALDSQARRLLEGGCIRIGADDLLLHEDEIATCAQHAYGADITAADAGDLYRATAGWGIALRLALRLRAIGKPLPQEARTPFTPEARADLFAYLAAEVLKNDDDRTLQFLRRTAVLDVLAPAVCARLTGEEHAVELIQSLAGAGLPVMKAGWNAYQCHGLLRDYLMARLTDTEIQHAHSEAAGAYTAVGDWPHAVRHFVEAGQHDAALRIADEHGRELVFGGHGRALLDLVKSAADSSDHYRATYWAAFAAARMFELDWASAAFQRVYEAAEERGDKPTALRALASLAQTLNGWGRYPQATAVAQQLLAAVPPEDRPRRAAVQLGYLITGMGGTAQFREAVALIRELLPQLDAGTLVGPAEEAYARSVAAVTLAMEGDLTTARAELHRAQALILGQEADDIHTFVPWSRALVAFMSGDPDGADDAAREAETVALQYGDLQRVLECRAVRASTATMRGDIDTAERGFAEVDALRAGGADYWGFVLTLLSRPERARLRGDIAGALASAEANHALAVSLGGARFICSTRLDVAYFRLLNGDADAAVTHAREALSEAEALSSPLLMYGAHLMLAASSPDNEQASIAAAMQIADERDYRFLMPYAVRLRQLDSALWRALGGNGAARAGVLLAGAGPATLAALRGMWNLDGEVAITAVEVARRFGQAAADVLRSLSSSTDRRVAGSARQALSELEAANPHGLSAREREVLDLLSRGMRTKDVAEELVLTPATVSTHIQRIMNKTGTSSRAELLALAAREARPPGA
jgi:LuxR family maltose regulon positive regulatory protein